MSNGQANEGTPDAPAYIPPSLRRKESKFDKGGSSGRGGGVQNRLDDGDFRGLLRRGGQQGGSGLDSRGDNGGMKRSDGGNTGGRGGGRGGMMGRTFPDGGRSGGGFSPSRGGRGGGAGGRNNNNRDGGAEDVDTGGEPVDTVIAWRSRGKTHVEIDVEKEALALFGDPETKRSSGGGSGINFDSFFDIPVSLSGNDCEIVKEIPSFKEAGSSIHPLLLENIGRIGYDKPTPVQKWAVPSIFAGRDLMASAQTGSGKTAAFLFPIISKMLSDGPPRSSNRKFNRSQKPNALVLSPTRELTTQIFEEAKKFSFNTGIRPVVVYGGTYVRENYEDLRKGCDVLIATPGRLLDHLVRQSVCLTECSYFVLDEADRMLDMGFSPQIAKIVDDYALPPKESRQTIMFSATFPSSIQNLAAEYMDDYLYLTVGRVGSTNECITQVVLYADEEQKPRRLLDLLNQVQGLTLIFVETKRKADKIQEYLSHNGIGAVSIHGDKSQTEREASLGEFRKELSSVMVATDVVARGLDIPNVTHVINHDMPSSIDDYVHRIGRTGRAGNKGRATTFLTENNGGVVRDLVNVLTEAKQETPQWLLDIVSQGSSFGRGRAGRGGPSGGSGMGGGRDSRHQPCAYSVVMDGWRRPQSGLNQDFRYSGGGAASGGTGRGNYGNSDQTTGYRSVKKKQAEDEFDGW